MEGNFWDILEEKRPVLTKTALAIADYITDHPEEAALASISSLASACGVADATLYRFCRQLGFNGYNEMKISLAQANVTPSLHSASTLKPGMNTQELIDHSLVSFQNVIQDTMTNLVPSNIEKAAELLRNAENVYCFGHGGSMMLVSDIWVRLSTISNKFHVISDSHLQLISASLMTPADVMLFVSYSGATHDVMDIFREAKRAGAKIILITHHKDSPAARLADIALYSGGNETPLEGGSIPVKAAVLFVADILVHRYTLDNYDLVKNARQRTTNAMAVKYL